MNPNAGKGGGGGRGASDNEYSCAHGAQINFGDLTPQFNLWRQKSAVFASFPVC
jgi:hypothetical protein